MTLQDPLIGCVLDGRYRVDARVAVGGMATVYRALDMRLDRVLALKVMHPALATDAAFVERFIREAKSAAGLDHPNIVGVTDQGTDGGYVYLAMEYVAGCTLRDVLRESGALQPRAVLDILEPVLAGLGAAHRGGLVHRDVKPENVLIGDDGRVKIADFGLVRGVDGQTSATTGSLLGTVSYLAPEQIQSGPLGPFTDVYACGVMLYEMLTGTKPHRGETPAQVLLAHVQSEMPLPSALVSGLPAELDGLVARAAARDPQLRPADAAVFLSMVRAARSRLTDAQLDAFPYQALVRPGPAAPADATGFTGSGSGSGPGSGPDDVTSVVPLPAVAVPPAEAPMERTAVIEVEPGGIPGPPPPGAVPGAAGEPPAGEPPARRGGPSRRALFSLLGLVLVALGAGAGVWYINSGQFLRTPGVLALTEKEARRTLERAGLGVEVEYAFSGTVEKGRVIETDPERGERVRRNAVITVVVSRGPEVVQVPDLAGVPLGEAKRLLTEAGLTPGEEEGRFHPAIARGAVIATDPAIGTELRPDTPVDLVVSRGAEVEVPDVLGLPEGTAQQRLREAGFEVEVAAGRVFSEFPAGAVAEQDPAGDSRAGEGETVTLAISKGPEMVVVPDVRGLGEDDAVRVLEDAGFEVSVQRFFFTGTVFNQSVREPDSAPKGSTITIFVR
ncbi:serine/threonine protein kinase [Streptomyces aidingensis]|uniref:non-specific serine/threonine protein kinase n=2 Tax=Streptomyces aidingensis TaxID=910347 RepID=A0A1I1LI88_9ACTN|nr:PASTA domain-containing protein [Streptomyces aidingensis]SFC72927.1 serine/threonine protein kinase [Streptomyces aidingensis]